MMRNHGKPWGDRARQTANVAAALFQVAVTTWAVSRIQAVTDADSRSLVQPAAYAFAIWAVIFALSLGYAVYQALPAQREDPLLRAIGWPTATAFLATGLWSVVVPLRGFALAQLFLLIIWACLALAFVRMISHMRDRSTTSRERWLVALPLAIFLGWTTAANAVSLMGEAGRRGLVTAGTTGEAILGSGLLLLGALVAVTIVRVGRAGPPQGVVAFVATIVWALTAIIVDQYDMSLLTTGTAVLGLYSRRRRLRAPDPAGAPVRLAGGGSAAARRVHLIWRHGG